jgi:hypothetical protein
VNAIDVTLFREGGASLSRTEEELVELTNGCVLRVRLLVKPHPPLA